MVCLLPCKDIRYLFINLFWLIYSHCYSQLFEQCKSSGAFAICRTLAVAKLLVTAEEPETKELLLDCKPDIDYFLLCPLSLYTQSSTLREGLTGALSRLPSIPKKKGRVRWCKNRTFIQGFSSSMNKQIPRPP